MSGENVWTRPSDGKRYCRACLSAARRRSPSYLLPAMAKAEARIAERENWLFNDETGKRMTEDELLCLTGRKKWKRRRPRAEWYYFTPDTRFEE